MAPRRSGVLRAGRVQTPAAWVVGLVACCAGCANARYDAKQAQHPSITMPHRFAEGTTQKDGTAQKKSADDSHDPDAATATTPATTAPSGSPVFDASSLPEPAPLSLRSQWEYVLAYRQGQVAVEGTRLRRFEAPVPTARRMGRFAVELWIGRELVERVRFDFPLLAGEAVPTGPSTPIDAPARLGPGADVRRTLLVPADERATRAELVDAATGSRTPLPWPPDAPIEPITPENQVPAPSSPSPHPAAQVK